MKTLLAWISHSYNTMLYTCTAVRKPTYGELIDLFEETECECPHSEDLLCSKFKKLYPNIYIGRPRRFYDTVLRIVAPTRPSLRAESKLTGSPLSSYRKRIWSPRIRRLSIVSRYQYHVIIIERGTW